MTMSEYEERFRPPAPSLHQTFTEVRGPNRGGYRDALDPRVVCAPYDWWQACNELGLPGYDPLSPLGANINLVIPNTHIDPISLAIRSGIAE